jgi:hypothetical protein
MSSKVFTIGAIGIGQAGTNMAQTFISKLGEDPVHLCTINLSSDDLEQAALIPAENRFWLDQNSHGAGKKRNVSKNAASQKVNELTEFLTKVLKGECNIIFTFFSTSGGTGSGAGPYLTALLESNLFKSAKAPRTCVIGIPLIGDLDEGQILLINTLSCLKEIDNLSTKKLARFMPIYNQSKIDIKNDIRKWQELNDDSSELIKRYLFKSYKSKYSNLDPEDKFVLLLTPGLHSLLTINPKDPSIIHTPFLLPEGASVQKMGCELPETASEDRFKLINALGANVTEPNYLGLYSDAESEAVPIIHFAGFNNLANFVQPYQIQISRLESLDATGSRANKEGSGFMNVDKNNDAVDKRNAMSSLKSASDLLAEL